MAGIELLYLPAYRRANNAKGGKGLMKIDTIKGVLLVEVLEELFTL